MQERSVQNNLGVVGTNCHHVREVRRRRNIRHCFGCILGDPGINWPLTKIMGDCQRVRSRRYSLPSSKANSFNAHGLPSCVAGQSICMATATAISAPAAGPEWVAAAYSGNLRFQGRDLIALMSFRSCVVQPTKIN